MHQGTGPATAKAHTFQAENDVVLILALLLLKDLIGNLRRKVPGNEQPGGFVGFENLEEVCEKT